MEGKKEDTNRDGKKERRVKKTKSRPHSIPSEKNTAYATGNRMDTAPRRAPTSESLAADTRRQRLASSSVAVPLDT